MAEDEKNKTTRTTFSLSVDDHAELERIAARKKVSIAWVVREAVERYLTAESPLFRQSQK